MEERFLSLVAETAHGGVSKPGCTSTVVGDCTPNLLRFKVGDQRTLTRNLMVPSTEATREAEIKQTRGSFDIFSSSETDFLIGLLSSHYKKKRLKVTKLNIENVEPMRPNTNLQIGEQPKVENTQGICDVLKETMFILEGFMEKAPQAIQRAWILVNESPKVSHSCISTTNQGLHIAGLRQQSENKAFRSPMGAMAP